MADNRWPELLTNSVCFVGIGIGFLALCAEGYFLLAYIFSAENPLRHEYLGGVVIAAMNGLPFSAVASICAYFAHRWVDKPMRIATYMVSGSVLSLVLIAIVLGIFS